MAASNDRIQRIKNHISLTSNVDMGFTSGTNMGNTSFSAGGQTTSNTEPRKRRIMEHVQRTRG